MPPPHTAIRNIKPGEKACKLFDGGGLYLLVKPNGARLWRMKYRVDGPLRLIRSASKAVCAADGVQLKHTRKLI